MTPAQILEDFRRRYEGTFVFVQEPNSSDEKLFQINAVIQKADKLGVLDMSSEEVGRIMINFGSAHTIRFKPAPVGMFQFGNEAFFCQRIPAKQYRRGICYDNTAIRSAVSSLVGFDNEVTFDSLKAAFAGKKYTYQAAVAMLSTGKYRSVAIEGNYALSLSIAGGEDYILFFFDWPIARVSKTGKVTLILEELFKSNIRQLTSEATNAVSA